MTTPVDVAAPPDLAELIDAWSAAMEGPDRRTESLAYMRLIKWPGYRRGLTYHHGDVRTFLALGSVKVGPWPRD